MTSSKNTKRALLASILSVALCCAMLIGSTFAWFTDSVTSSGNQIIAGNLKVDLIHVDDGKEVSIKDNPNHKIFNYDKWEPGYTVMETLKVVNKGNLALKFRLDAVAAGATAAPTGEKLADVIDVYVYEGAGDPADTTSFADMTEANGWRKAGSLSTLMADPDGIARGVLLPEKATLTNGEPVKEVQMTVALHMQEGAGNAYQGLTLGDLNFTLMAAQYTYEKDSFDNQYDAGATFGETIEVGNDATSLEEAMNTPFVPVEINVTENISNGGTLEVTGDVTMNLGKNMIHNSTSAVTGADIDVKDGGKLTINAEANSYGFDYTAGKLAASGNGSALTVNGGRYGDSGSGNSDVTAENGAAVTINSGRFSTSGYQGHAVMATSGGTMYINGGSYSSSGAQSVVIYADGGTIYVEGFDSLTANGRNFGVANDGVIYISKTASPSKPTSIASGCKVTEEDNYWVISAE